MLRLWRIPREKDLPDVVVRESCAGDGVDIGELNGVAEADESTVDSVS